MKEWVGDELRIIGETRSFSSAVPSAFLGKESAVPRHFHESIPGYAVTPLIRLPALARRLGVKDICVKDESKRFSLNAFKGLGGSYAMFRILCERLSMNPAETSLTELTVPENREKLRGVEFVTCTDGNHGRGVSWAAGLFGCRAHVFMPCGTREVRAEAIRKIGPADVVITEFNYDDTVKLAKEMSEERGWILIQDTA